MRLILSAVICAFLVAWLRVPGFAAEPHDGAHDFDFNFGTWHTHIKYQTKALSGTSEFIEMDGTVLIRVAKIHGVIPFNVLGNPIGPRPRGSPARLQWHNAEHPAVSYPSH